MLRAASKVARRFPHSICARSTQQATHRVAHTRKLLEENRQRLEDDRRRLMKLVDMRSDAVVIDNEIDNVETKSCKSTSAGERPLGYYLEGNADSSVNVMTEMPTAATFDLLGSLLKSKYGDNIDFIGKSFYYVARHIETGQLIEWMATINTNHGRIDIVGDHHRIHIIV